ncbi:MAG: tRNA lysidine(34) synthetase TilS [Woeseiaceae bacterium]
MSFSSESLLRKLRMLANLAGAPTRLVIGYSGGLDSTVLLHALAATRDEFGTVLSAIHVDHGLHEDSANWAQHCATFAKTLGVEFTSLAVDVETNAGQGTEAAARRARYDALRTSIHSGDWLLSAHHRDDQAETLLLNLLRGSGPAGLAGIGEVQPFAEGWLVRPLLSCSRRELQDYANEQGLAWIDDPSNEDRQFDRNYLRHEVMPRLEQRWPEASSRLQQSALLAGEAATMLDQLADTDLQAVSDRPERLSATGLRTLSSERQRNLLRYVVRELGLPAPPSGQLWSVVDDLVPARDDAQPLVEWPGVEVRRYRDCVYILAAAPEAATVEPVTMSRDGIELGAGMGELQLRPGADIGLSDAVIDRGLEIRYRQGGEEIKPLNQRHTKKLKKLLQEEGVVPWMRERLPLVYSGDELVAVGDLWLAADAVSKPGTAVTWRNRPPIH